MKVHGLSFSDSLAVTDGRTEIPLVSYEREMKRAKVAAGTRPCSRSATWALIPTPESLSIRAQEKLWQSILRAGMLKE